MLLVQGQYWNTDTPATWGGSPNCQHEGSGILDTQHTAVQKVRALCGIKVLSAMN